MRFAICSEIFQGWEIEKAIEFAAKAGYHGIEIAPFTLARDVNLIPAARRQAIADCARKHGIRISGIHWVLVQTEGLHLTSPDEAVRAKTARYFVDLVDFCADIGGRYIIVGSPKQRNLAEGVDKAAAVEWLLALFDPAVRQAEERGVTICLEPLSTAETNFINTASEAVEIARHMRSPHFQIILDVKAMSSESLPIPEIIRNSAGEFAYFHANDRNLKGPGFGDVDFRPILGALDEVGYAGWVSVEVFDFSEGPERIAVESLANLKRAMPPGAGQPGV